MGIIRHYQMRAHSGGARALIEALTRLATEIRPLEGCLGFEILQGTEDPELVVFIERWSSINAHKSTGDKVTIDVLSPVMAAVSGGADGTYLRPVLDL